MGGAGSGRRHITTFPDPVKNLIKMARSFGVNWGEIAKTLGYKGTDSLEHFKRNNPEFVDECEAAFLTRKLSYAQKLEKASIKDDGTINTLIAIKFMEQFGMFLRDDKPTTAIQVNSNAGIQVAFVEPGQLIQQGINNENNTSENDTIDALLSE
jgi:hypothetical protein